ncbi:FeoA domain-containing protein, partial [Leuconostoc mesenteroides]|uniref:FeoA domain-containing protein n=1 Tax=Leuconostoc mesenteroides TaxID=1245 RepID=UPI0036F4A07E
MGMNKGGVVGKIVGNKGVGKGLMDMGIRKNRVVRIEGVGGLGEAIELVVRGYKLRLRKSEGDVVV